MRAINVLLAILVSVLIGALVLELGLRLMGKAPQPTINRFDPVLGWSKTPNSTGHRKTSEFDVTYTINEQGLRDDPMPSPAKPAGAYRVVVLGDSFVLGYTVDRHDLFVDQLEDWWTSEGRNVDVVNAGTEGWSTDQEVLWLQKNGAQFQPDLVLLCTYENDLFWNSQNRYLKFPKPRFNPSGVLEPAQLVDPGTSGWFQKLALGKTISDFGMKTWTWSPDGSRRLPGEYGAFWTTPPEFMVDAIARTRGALLALDGECKKLGASLLVAPIPGKVAIQPEARNGLANALGASEGVWSPDQPVETVLALCKDLGIRAVDARAAMRDAQAREGDLYFANDWHFNPDGNRAFAGFLHGEIEKAGLFPAAFAAQRAGTIPEAPPKTKRVPAWVFWYAGLWLVFGTIFTRMYRDWPAWKGYLGVAVMLGLVFAIAVGGSTLLGKLPPQYGRAFLVVFLGGLFVFIAYKLGRRLSTISELLVAFTRRGHWYLMPLVVVLLSIGSLLVVAASSPLVAPFIYTLF